MRFNRFVLLALAIIVCVISGQVTFAAADTYVTDTAHTLVGFTVRHLVITKVRGKFNEFVGTITYDEHDITKSALQGTIKTASIDTDNEKRDKHLRSADFFDAANHPEITFASKRIEKKDDGYVMIGDLSIRGITQEVEMPFSLTGKMTHQGKTRIGFEASLRINRKDFGVAYHNVTDSGGLVVSDTVDIELVGEAIKTG